MMKYLPSKLIKIISYLITFILGVLLCFGGMKINQKINDKTRETSLSEKIKEDEKKISVTSYPLVRQNLQNIFSTQGHLKPFKEVTLYPGTQLTVTKIYVSWGMKIKKGDPLFRVNSKAMVIKDKLSKIESEIQSSDFQAMSKLMQKEIISENEFQQKKLEFESQKLRRELQKEEFSSGDHLSPIDGIVAEINMKEGDYVDRSDKYSLKVIDDSSLKFQHYLPQNLAKKIKVGDKVEIEFSDKDQELHRGFGVVDGISPIIDAETGTIYVSVKVAKKELIWKPGIFVRVNFIIEMKKNILAVKNSSILYEKGAPYTFKIKIEGEKKYAQKVSLKLGMNNGQFTEIIGNNLNNKDQIIDQGISIVSDQSLLEIFNH